jgi:hypothetical protein
MVVCKQLRVGDFHGACGNLWLTTYDLRLMTYDLRLMTYDL